MFEALTQRTVEAKGDKVRRDLEVADVSSKKRKRKKKGSDINVDPTTTGSFEVKNQKKQTDH